MGRIIVVGAVVIILALILVSFLYLLTPRDKKKGDLSFKQEREQYVLLTKAAKTMSAIGIGYSIDDVDILPETTRTNIDNWLNEYNKYRKEIESA